MMPLIKNLANFWVSKRVDFPYRCETCGKGYQHRATLVRHTRHECGKEPQFKCPYCAHRTKQRDLSWSGYHYHGGTVDERKIPLTSNTASSKIPQRSSSCLDKKPGCFRCPRCNKGYRWLRNMKNHLRIECGKDPKECCPYCPHRTKYKSSLQKHILRIHFG
ncbi:zinc finger protein 358-like [Hylaeus anthracinus]|uniref:zinc finger protein 358-like n=1 Tax=Hylaeus volcanicus TaxID=313075 RepID=UPI0023B84D1D|nr:zinc finger protein 358-like [Hylaeus volcanicus]XP_053996932.1 zinc finger protein 358-like [Hylaeus anthracinus]